MPVDLRPRDRVRLTASRTTRTRGVDALESRWGWLHTVDDLGGVIRHRRVEDTVPPFTATATVASGAEYWSPRIARDRYQRLWVGYIRENGDDTWDALEAYSDDDGETWGGGTTIFTGATYCDVATAAIGGMILRGGLISGTLWITRQYPGDSAAGSEINTGVTLDSGQFVFAFAREGPGRWLLIGVSGGAAVNYSSSDDGATWDAI